MPNLLQNHIAAVTGAGSGIGAAIAKGYAREGSILAVLDIDKEAAEKTAAEIKAEAGKASAFALDVTDAKPAAPRQRWSRKKSGPSRSS